jgi:hypothetical protein
MSGRSARWRGHSQTILSPAAVISASNPSSKRRGATGSPGLSCTGSRWPAKAARHNSTSSPLSAGTRATRQSWACNSRMVALAQNRYNATTAAAPAPGAPQQSAARQNHRVLTARRATLPLSYPGGAMPPGREPGATALHVQLRPPKCTTYCCAGPKLSPPATQFADKRRMPIPIKKNAEYIRWRTN